MSGRTITITDPAEVRAGDLATLTSTVSPAVLTAPLSHDPDVQRDVVILALRIPGLNGEHSTSVVVRRDKGAGWTVSATREVPEHAPGTRGTVRGLPAIVAGRGRVVAINPAYADRPTDGIETYRLDQSFVPDPDTAALRAEVERLTRLEAAYRGQARGYARQRNEARDDAAREHTRAEAAEARLARLTPEAVRVAVQVGAWIPDHQKDAQVRRVLALVAADEQAAEGEVPATLPTRERIADAIRGNYRATVWDFLRAHGVPENRIIVNRDIVCVGPMDAANDVLALLTGAES